MRLARIAESIRQEPGWENDRWWFSRKVESPWLPVLLAAKGGLQRGLCGRNVGWKDTACSPEKHQEAPTPWADLPLPAVFL